VGLAFLEVFLEYIFHPVWRDYSYLSTTGLLLIAILYSTPFLFGIHLYFKGAGHKTVYVSNGLLTVILLLRLCSAVLSDGPEELKMAAAVFSLLNFVSSFMCILGADSVRKRRYIDMAEFSDVKKFNVETKDDKGWTPLHWAAEKGCKDAVEYFLTAKSEINAKDYNGETPLHMAASKGHTDVAELLRQHGGHE
jgi:ankyrin repeat protein